MARPRVARTDIDALHEMNLAYIRSRPARLAYLHLIRLAHGLNGFDCYPTLKGVVRDFRYFTGGKFPFAFIVNLDSILFYIRKPAYERFQPRLQQLQERFRDVNLPRSYEITIRIVDVDDAKRLMEEVFNVVDT